MKLYLITVPSSALKDSHRAMRNFEEDPGRGRRLSARNSVTVTRIHEPVAGGH
jgi:hypothetical protein